MRKKQHLSGAPALRGVPVRGGVGGEGRLPGQSWAGSRDLDGHFWGLRATCWEGSSHVCTSEGFVGSLSLLLYLARRSGQKWPEPCPHLCHLSPHEGLIAQLLVTPMVLSYKWGDQGPGQLSHPGARPE